MYTIHVNEHEVMFNIFNSNKFKYFMPATASSEREKKRWQKFNDCKKKLSKARCDNFLKNI